MFGAAAAALYYVLQPTTVRIAVGPPGSDDQKLVQLMAQTFARDHSPIRLSLIATQAPPRASRCSRPARPTLRSRAAI